MRIFFSSVGFFSPQEEGEKFSNPSNTTKKKCNLSARKSLLLESLGCEKRKNTSKQEERCPSCALRPTSYFFFFLLLLLSLLLRYYLLLERIFFSLVRTGRPAGRGCLFSCVDHYHALSDFFYIFVICFLMRQKNTKLNRNTARSRSILFFVFFCAKFFLLVRSGWVVRASDVFLKTPWSQLFLCLFFLCVLLFFSSTRPRTSSQLLNFVCVLCVCFFYTSEVAEKMN